MGVIGDVNGESSEVVDEDASETSVPLDEAEASDSSERSTRMQDQVCRRASRLFTTCSSAPDIILPPASA
jgi:hypothetical protein